MMDSILKTIAKLFGYDDEYDHFNTDLIVFINTAFNFLTQLGIGPEEGFRIAGTDETWSDFTNDKILLEMVKSYVYMKVKLSFDPPSSGTVMQAYKDQLQELEYRIYIQANPVDTFETEKVSYSSNKDLFE